MAALLAAGAATATATTTMAPSLRMRARAVERAHLVPHGFFFSFTTVALQTTPVDVVRNGVTYGMSMTVYQDTGPGGTLELRLSRVAPDGRAFQAHSYTFSPQSGIHLTYDKKTLQTAAARHDDRDHAEPGHGRVRRDVGEVEDVPAVRRADGDEASRHGDAVVERVRRRDLDGAVLRDDPHAAGDGQDRQGPGLLAGSSSSRAPRTPCGRSPRSALRSSPLRRMSATCSRASSTGRSARRSVPAGSSGSRRPTGTPRSSSTRSATSQVPPDERRIPRHRGPGREVEPPEARQGWRRPLRGVDLGVGRRVHDRLGDVHVRPTGDSDGPLLPGWRPDAAFRPPHVPRNTRARRVEPSRRGVRHPAARASRGHAGHVHRARLRPPGLETPYPIPGGRSPRRVSTF